MAFLLADTVLVFDHLKHRITVVANAFVEGRDVDGPYERAVERIAAVKQKLLAPLPASAYGLAEDDDVEGGGRARRRRSRRTGPAVPRPVTSSMTREQYEARRGAHPRVHPRRRRLPGGAQPALQHAGRRRPVLRLPRAPRREPEPVPVLHRLRRLRPLRLQPRAAHHRAERPGGDASHRRHAAARRQRRRGQGAHRRPAGRREGARRARHARRPRAQRPRARVRAGHRAPRGVHEHGAVLPRHPHGLERARHAGARTARRSTRSRPPSPPAP